MAQTRFWNFKEEDLTSLLIRWMTGMHPSGRYFGYDFNPTADLNLNLVHSTTGFKYVDVVPAESGFQSLAITRQGTLILEDSAVTVNNISIGDPTNPRIDIIILTHERLESAGGSQALYSVIEGTPAASPSPPAITDILRQTIIGQLLVPSNMAQLDDVGVVWTPSKKPTFANGTPLDDINLGSNLAIETDASGGVIGSSVTSTELGYLSGATSAIQTQLNGKEPTITGGATTIVSSNLTANRALISNASGKVAAHATVSDTELGFLNGVTSAIQTQLDSKEDNITGAVSPWLTSNMAVSKAVVTDAGGKIATSNVTSLEIVYLAGATSAIQTQLNGKQATITGGATTIVSSNLTANRALISNASGKVSAHGTVSDTELGYLNGVTSAIQTQLNDITTSLDSLNFKRVNITNWNCTTTALKTVAHGVASGATNIKFIQVRMIDDNGKVYDFVAGNGTSTSSGALEWDDTNMELRLNGSNVFDIGTEWDASTGTRAEATIAYI